MTVSLLDRVLLCPTLPTLPGVAVRVLELTRDPDVSIATMAQTVQADPALAVKVLKTVNSSYYGLSAPCPSISRAMSMLGLNAVKAIVLGFSLLDSTKTAGIDDRFDMASYWRRAVHCAAAARVLATSTGCCDPEEAFIAAIVQDIGMLACFAAIRPEYLDVLRQAPPDHDLIPAIEQRALGFDHAHVGKLLAQRWRLPSQLVECIGSHHNVTGTGSEPSCLVRVVYLAGQVTGALILRDNKRKLGEFITKAREWYNFDQPHARDLLKQCAGGAAELSKALELKTGAAPSISNILSEAREQMVVAQEAVQAEAAQLRKSNDELSRRTITDGLTGAFNRAHFDHELHAAFQAAKAERKPLAVIFIDGDKFKSVNDTHGHQAGDAVLIELAKRLQGPVGQRGSVFRYGGEEFVVLLPNVGLAAATRFGEMLRTAVGGTPFDLRPHNMDLSLNVTISLGVAAMEPAFADAIAAPEQIMQGADRAVYAAKAAGRNRVAPIDLRSAAQHDQPIASRPVAPSPPKPADASPPKAPGPSPSKPAVQDARGTVMIVEDDPLAARLMSFLFGKRQDLRPVVVRSGEEALDWMANPAHPRPDLVLADLNLPGISGIDLIRLAREKLPGRRLPFLIVSATGDPNNQAASLAAGADAFIDKAEFCTNTDHWLATIGWLIEQTRKAA
jgi:diguanylate cyclase (GGDEF)-like protein